MRDNDSMLEKAIRINQSEVIEGNDYDYHIDILVAYQERTGLTDDQADDMIDAGLIEFGSMFPNMDGGKYVGGYHFYSEMYASKIKEQ